MQAELTVHAIHQGGGRVHTSDGQFDVVMDYPIDREQLLGPTPLAMLLASLAACSLNSVKVILRKMQQPVAGLEVRAQAARSTEHPTILREVSLAFRVKGDGVDPAAVERAIHLSEERFCPVWNMLSPSTAIKAEFQIESTAPQTTTA